MKIRDFAFVFLGCSWLASDLYLMVGNVILRETRLGVIANLLDRLPTALGTPIFIFLWLIGLFGWIVPLALGLKHLVRGRAPR
jgi:hypothetical protein